MANRRYNPRIYLSWLISSLFCVGLFVSPVSAAPATTAPPVSKASLAAVTDSAGARAFFLGDPQGQGTVQAWYCADGKQKTNDCTKSPTLDKPFLRVEIQRPGSAPATSAIFPIVSLATSNGAFDNAAFNLWIFRSEDNPKIAIGYRAISGGANSAEFAFLPADPGTDLTAVKALAKPTSDQKITAVSVRGDPQLPDEATQGAGEKAKQWGLKTFDLGDDSNAIGRGANSAFDRAMAAAAGAINSLLSAIIEQYSNLVKYLLSSDYLRFFDPTGTPTTTVGDSGTSITTSSNQTQAVVSVWNFTRSLANVVFLLLLLAIAFGNVLRLEAYAIRALLPRFIIAVVLVNFSLIIVQVFLDFINIVTTALLGGIDFHTIIASQAVVAAGGAGTLVDVAFFNSSLLVAVALAVLAVVALLIVRIALIWFLVATAPIAMIFSVLPATRGIYEDWRENLLRFALIAPILAIMLRIAAAFSSAPVSASTGGQLLQTLLVVALVFLAGIIPVMVGGRFLKVIEGWAKNRGEGLRGSMLERSRGRQAMSQISEQFSQRAALRGAGLSDAIGGATGGRIGTFGAREGLLVDQAGKRENQVAVLTTAERRARMLDRGVDMATRVAMAQSLAQANLLGDDVHGTEEQLHRLEASGISQPLLSAIMRDLTKKNITWLNDSTDALRLRHRDYLSPKFITDESGTALWKHVIRMSTDDLRDLDAGQLGRLPARLKREIHFSEFELEKLSQRHFYQFMTPERITQILRRIERGGTESQIIRDIATQIDPEGFGRYGLQTQRSVIRRFRDGPPYPERDRGRRSLGAQPLPGEESDEEIEGPDFD